jgi:hypothetical protein
VGRHPAGLRARSRGGEDDRLRRRHPARSSASTPSTGYIPLLAGRGKRAAVVYTSAVWGPALGAEFGRDFPSTYVDDWLRWTGTDDITAIRCHPRPHR